jgi:hypothetical protein
VQTSFDTLTALTWPLFKLLLVYCCLVRRDFKSSAHTLRRQLVRYDLAFPHNSMRELVHLYRLYRAIKTVRYLHSVEAGVGFLIMAIYCLMIQPVHWIVTLAAYQVF